MNDLSAFLIVVLQFVFCGVLIFIGWTWVLNRLAPKGTLRRRILNRGSRLILVGPPRGFYQTARWTITRLISNDPQFRSNQTYLEQYPVTPLQLYAAIELTFLNRRIIGAEIERVARLEWHLLSTRRIFLLIRCREVVCFIGSAPFGTGLLVSWRYTASPGRLLLTLFQIPYLGFVAENLLRPPTFYREDYRHAFEQAIRGIVLEATDRLTVEQAVRPLQENEVGPLLQEFYQT